MKHSNKTIV